MSAVSYLVYNLSTGRLDKQVVCPENHIAMQLSEEQGCVEGSVTAGDYYVDLVTLKAVKQVSFELGALPLPCTVTIEGVSYECDAQPEFEFDVPGVYLIEVDAGPKYLRKEFSYAYPPQGF